jgi:hypothetical protein
MRHRIMCSIVVAVLGGAGCRNTEPPSRTPEAPPPPSSSAVPRVGPTSQKRPPSSGESPKPSFFGDKGRRVALSE